MPMLHQILDEYLKDGGADFYKNLVPPLIYSNLKASYGKRPYQQEAFGRFVFYWNEYRNRSKNRPAHLLFHMATGSGKTLIMAGLIIYLYERGYRNFLFFVNSTNLIEKTKDNFLNPSSSKYLFSRTLFIGDKEIQIKEVENFQEENPDDIHIIFTTIQGLHSRLNQPKENSISYQDFEDKKIVFISDEAHHINVETKKINKEDSTAMVNWESTVNRLLNTNNDNILLEFTATADLSIPAIKKKYSDKLIYDYPLKEFRKNGYSKEVKVLQADLPPFGRALQAVILSQYRRKIFEKYKQPVKPVILFKSRTIKDSEAFLEEFTEGIKQCKVADLYQIKNSKPDKCIKRIFTYLEDNILLLKILCWK